MTHLRLVQLECYTGAWRKQLRHRTQQGGISTAAAEHDRLAVLAASCYQRCRLCGDVGMLGRHAVGATAFLDRLVGEQASMQHDQRPGVGHGYGSCSEGRRRRRAGGGGRKN